MQPQWSSGIPLKIWSLQVRPWTLNSFWIVWLILLSIEILRRRPRSASQTQYNRQNYQLPKETVCSHLFFKISCWGRSASGLARRDREKLFFLSMILSESIRQIFIFNSLFFQKKYYQSKSPNSLSPQVMPIAGRPILRSVSENHWARFIPRSRQGSTNLSVGHVHVIENFLPRFGPAHEAFHELPDRMPLSPAWENLIQGLTSIIALRNGRQACSSVMEESLVCIYLWIG